MTKSQETAQTTPENEVQKLFAGYIRTEISGKGIPEADMPPMMEVLMLKEAPFEAASMGNNIGCDIAGSMGSFPAIDGKGVLGDKFKNEAGRAAALGALTIMLAVVDQMMASIVRSVKNAEFGVEEAFMAFSSGMNILVPLVALTHAVKDLCELDTPDFVRDRIAHHVKTLGELAPLLVAARSGKPVLAVDNEAQGTVH